MMSSSSGSSPSPFHVRPVEARDRAAIEASLRSTPGAFTEEEVVVALELVDEALAKGERDYIVRVLDKQGAGVVGYTCYGRAHFTEATWDLYWIAVHKDHHGDGSAKRLMTFAEEDVRARGGRLLLVETASKESYARTRAFYEKIGYVEISRIPDFYKRGDDKITYWKAWR